MGRRLFIIFAVLGFVLVVVGCDFAPPPVVVITAIIVPTTETVVTNTVVPVITMTLRFTATLIPTSTFTPEPSLGPTTTPAPVVELPTIAPTTRPVFSGTTNSNQTSINVRTGPATSFDVIRRLKPNTKVSVLGLNDTKDWYLARLDDGTLGWIATSFVNVSDQNSLQALIPAEQTQIALETPAPASTAAATLVAHDPRVTDVLAYCDDQKFQNLKRAFYSSKDILNVYWEWEALTAEQVQDQVDNAVYEVKLDDKLLEGWVNYRTGVRKATSGKKTVFQVYWYLPVGKLDVGQHKIDYKLTWKQKISDGEKNFGPGGDEESNTGTCTFIVK